MPVSLLRQTPFFVTHVIRTGSKFEEQVSVVGIVHEMRYAYLRPDISSTSVICMIMLVVMVVFGKRKYQILILRVEIVRGERIAASHAVYPLHAAGRYFAVRNTNE